jgi:hypothetical protein
LLLSWLPCAPVTKRKGIGSKLLKFVIVYKKKRVKEFDIMAKFANKPTISFCQKYGILKKSFTPKRKFKKFL